MGQGPPPEPMSARETLARLAETYGLETGDAEAERSTVAIPDPRGTGAMAKQTGAKPEDESGEPAAAVRTPSSSTHDLDRTVEVLIRTRIDREAGKMWIERFEPSGEWVFDPALFEELTEPGTDKIGPDEARAIESRILATGGYSC